MFSRALYPAIEAALRGAPRKAILLFGPRQVGKTTLLRALADGLGGRQLTLNGDFADDHERLRAERGSLSRLVSGLDWLFVDEAQNVPQIGLVLKLIHDHFPDVRVLATASSAFDLARRTGEPLTGRQRTFLLYPVSYGERSPDPLTSRGILEQSMLHGSYPEVLTIAGEAERVAHLRQLAADALLKDIYAHVDVNRRKLLDILKLLAMQIGAEVSLNEIARTVQIDAKTVSRYLDLLEDAFVIVRMRGFSRNLRKEVGKSQKVLFLDLGIRNAILNRFEPLTARDDAGALWESLMVVERMKRNSYAGIAASYHFWRTYDQQEIDLVEEVGTTLRAFEFKWGHARRRMPEIFAKTYPEATMAVVDPDAAHAFLTLPTD